MSLNVNLSELAILLSVLLRLSVILFMLPIFSSAQVPANFKALAVLALSIMLFPFVRDTVQPVSFEPATVCAMIIGELIYGIIFSLSMLIVIAAFQFAGELAGVEMGFGFAQTADPQTGGQFSVTSVWTQMLAVMVLFALNGHHVALRLIIESFQTIPIGGFSLDSAVFQKMLKLSGLLFALAMKLAAPVMAVLILVQIGLGLMSKFAPQMNILATSFPITITLGILFLGLTVVIWGEMAQKSFADMFVFLRNLPR